jgi:hypothetical protein
VSGFGADSQEAGAVCGAAGAVIWVIAWGCGVGETPENENLFQNLFHSLPAGGFRGDCLCRRIVHAAFQRDWSVRLGEC